MAIAIKEKKKLFVSYSSINGFRRCPRYYYWKYIRRLERKIFKLPFIVGRIMHTGVQALFSDPDTAEKAIKKKYKEEAQKARTEFPEMAVYQEEDLNETEYVTLGMFKAFRVYYRKFLEGAKHVASEKAIRYDLNNRVVIVGAMDNIVESQKKNWGYELKNLKSLDMERVSAIKTDPQTSLYFPAHNRSVPKQERLDGILYQIIRKPQIRQKKKESRGEYFRRLEEWYMDQTDGMKFHLERVKRDDIEARGEAMLKMVEKVSKQMLDAGFNKENYFQDQSYCIHEWGQCQFYDLCHGDEEKNIKLYQIRKKFKVQDNEEAAIVADEK